MSRKILIVDDEENITLVLKELFASQGYMVRIAFTGKDAVKYMGKERFDLALLDIQIPDLNGIEILKHIRKTLPAMKTVVLTGFLEEYKEEIERIGCDALLSKPFSINTLVKVVDSTLLKRKEDRDRVPELIEDPDILASARLLFVEPNAIMYSSKLNYFKDPKRCRGHYELQAAFTEKGAMEKLKAFKPDIVLSDIGMFRLYKLADKFSGSANAPKDIILYGLSGPGDSDRHKNLSFIGGFFDPITAAVNPAEMDKLGRIVRATAIAHKLYTPGRTR